MIYGMSRTGIVLDKRYLNHLTPGWHPESPARIAALLEFFDTHRRKRLLRIEPRPATRGEVALLHSAPHIDLVARSAEQDEFVFDPDTFASKDSYDTALLAAGGFLRLLDAICSGEIENGFAFVRPPGHHAESDRAMGFCLFNNIAIGARFLRNVHGIERILIVDWDVHHGNGTQRAFYSDRSVLFVSLHRAPFYPGTGSPAETGNGDGAGYTVNIPLPAGTEEAGYLAAFERIIAPIARQFDPQFILISAGFDCHERDPLGGMRVRESGFRNMTGSLMRIASDHAGGRIAAVLEGGYDLPSLVRSAGAVIDEMGGARRIGTVPELGKIPEFLLPVLGIQSGYWRFETP